MRTYYDVLGIESSASIDEIEAAYRAQLKETHPDVSDDADARDDVQAVIEARDVLTDETERAKYDRLGHQAYVATTDSTSQAQSATVDSDADGGTATAAGTTTAWGAHMADDSGDADPTSSTAGGDNAVHGNDAGGRERTTPGQGDDAWSTRASKGRHSGDSDGGAVAWSSGSGYAVRQSPVSTAVDWWQLLPDEQSAVLLLTAVIGYPPLVVSTFFPPFPLAVNVLVGACTLVVTIYLVSIPQVGAFAFGFWSLVATGIVVFGEFPAIAIVIALVVTVVPFVLSLAVFSMAPSPSV